MNSGRATKESSIEETARKTNLEAAEEVARQLRLRDLAGLIVIDFIDMEDRRNNIAVEKRLKDKLKTDRARIQIGRISSFGLLEMSRQRLRPGMLEASTQPCPHCHGTGITRSDDSMSLAILRELEEEGVRRRCKEVLVSVPINVSNYMLNQKREHVAMIESRFGLSVRIEADPHLISPEYRVERLKVATRIVPQPEVLETAAIEYAPEVLDETSRDEPEAATPETEEEGAPKKRRRRRRRGGKGRNGEQQAGENVSEETAETEAPASDEVVEATEDKPAEEEAKPKRSRTRTRRKTAEPVEEKADATETEAPALVEVPEGKSDVAEKPKRKRAPRKPKVVAEVVDAPAEVAAPAPTPEPAPEPTPEPVIEQKPEDPTKPKRRGWWSLK